MGEAGEGGGGRDPSKYCGLIYTYGTFFATYISCGLLSQLVTYLIIK